MSAARHSRTGLPFSHVSATAMASRFASMRSAMRVSTSARSAGEVFAHAGNAFQPASTAASTSFAVPRAISVNGLPVTGLMSSKYWPSAGGTYRPPMKWS